MLNRCVASVQPLRRVPEGTGHFQPLPSAWTDFKPDNNASLPDLRTSMWFLSKSLSVITWSKTSIRSAFR